MVHDSRAADRQNEPGTVLADLGDLAGARTHHERALAIDAAVLGPDYPMVAADRGNLNWILQKLEDHERTRAVEKLKTDACRHVSFGYVEQSQVAGTCCRRTDLQPI